jgi:hypothetical protein
MAHPDHQGEDQGEVLMLVVVQRFLHDVFLQLLG